MKKSNVLIYLLLAVLFILLREPLYEMWSGWGPVARLSAIVPSLWNDAAAMMCIVLGVPAMVVFAQHLSYTGNRWARVQTERQVEHRKDLLRRILHCICYDSLATLCRHTDTCIGGIVDSGLFQPT